MNKKRGLTILSILICMIFLFGCGSKESAVTTPDSGIIPPQQIAEANAKNINAILNSFVSDYGKRETYSSPSVKQINEMRGHVSSLENILANTNFKNHAGLQSCLDKMKRYTEFIDLSNKRNQKVEMFAEKMGIAFKETESTNFEYSLRLNKESRVLLAELEATDLLRKDLNILPVSDKLISSWNLYIESLRILEQAWLAAQNLELEVAEQHDANFYEIYNQAIEAGDEDPIDIAGIKVKNWFQTNIAPCANIV